MSDIDADRPRPTVAGRPHETAGSGGRRSLRLQALRLVLLDVRLELRRVHRIMRDEKLWVRLGRGNSGGGRRVWLGHSRRARAGFRSDLSLSDHVFVRHKTRSRRPLQGRMSPAAVRDGLLRNALPLRRFKGLITAIRERAATYLLAFGTYLSHNFPARKMT